MANYNSAFKIVQARIKKLIWLEKVDLNCYHRKKQNLEIAKRANFDHFSKAMVKQNCEKIANFRAELTLTIDPKTKKKN